MTLVLTARRRALSALARGVLAAALGFAFLGSGCDKRSDAPPTKQSEPAAAAPSARILRAEELAVFGALPEKIERPDNLLTDEKVALGKMLWFDARLSAGQDVSCNSCHDVTKSGADTAAASSGTKKQPGTRNAPTIFNAAGTFAQGWDARATLVEDFVVPHAAEPSVMAADEKRLVATVQSISAYATQLATAFPDAKPPVSGETIAKAIAAYTRKLLTPSRWDRFLTGDASALTEAEKAGLGVFIDGACTTCHALKYVGGSQSQKLGIARPWPSAPGKPVDPGRFGITHEAVDKDFFKVPTLRNVTRTAPYLHDGSVTSLLEITKLMARHQVGKELSDAQAGSIVTFLDALSGEAPKTLVTKPELPPSGAKTPKPD